jgi:hypothetical protein
MRQVRRAAQGAGPVAAGAVALTLGLETHTFTRIECRSAKAKKGGTVWHCTGRSPAQARASDRDRQEREMAALRAHVDGVPSHSPRRVTDLAFVAHDGRRDPRDRSRRPMSRCSAGGSRTPATRSSPECCSPSSEAPFWSGAATSSGRSGTTGPTGDVLSP